MELEWESRPVSIPHHPRDWHDRSQPAAGPSTSAAPSAFTLATSALSQRRRSSAAHTRPAGPPPNLPIPSVPLQSSTPPQGLPALPDPPEQPLYPQTYVNGTSTASGSSSFVRPGASANLAAVAAFSQSRHPSSSSYSPGLSASSSVENLSDPPPRSILPSASSRALDQHQDLVPDRLLLSPPEPRMPTENRPSSRRALMRALELAREAVSLDSTNDDPYAAVQAYGRSVALLSEVMERVRRGEDSTETNRRRNGRRRSIVAQEEEVRRLKSIHDTYADRMNILSLIYSIPPIPHSTSSVYSNMSASTDSTQPSSPTTSASPSSETSESIPTSTYMPNDPRDDYMEEHAGHDREQDGMEAIGSAMFGLDGSSHNPPSSHPYALTSQYESLPHTVVTPPTNPPQRSSTLIRRPRAPSNLPPPPPPPLNSPPPAPIPPATPVFSDPFPDPSSSQIPRHLDVVNRQRGDSVGHKRTGSGSRLAPLEEENEKYGDAPESKQEESRRYLLPDTPKNSKRESHPLPPLPSPSSASTSSSGTPRTSMAPEKAPPSPRMANIVPRPRGASQPPTRSETTSNLINTSTNQGTIYQRRSKILAPPSTRSSSPTGSTASTGSVPLSKPPAASVPSSTTPVLTRTRAHSQPGQRPSGRMSPDPPPLPVSAGLNGSNTHRKPSFPSKLNPNSQPPSLTVQTDVFSPSGMLTAISLVPPPPILGGNLPTTPPSPLPPAPPNDPLRKPYHMMNLLRNTMTSQTGGYVTRRLHVPQEVWSQGGAKLTNLAEKVRVVDILCSSLEDLQICSSDYFGAGNVSSGLALGIGSIGRKEAEAWISKLEEFSSVCDGVVTNFGKKLGVGEGFVLKKSTGVSNWGSKLTRRFDKLTNGKNLDSPAAYVQGLKQLFLHAQLLDEHTKAVLSQPAAPAYAAFPSDIRSSAETKLKRSSEFFASVVLTFVIRDLSQLLDKYAKKCEKWLAE